jgi:RimJ/RimL family protein N-acetyltransferase
MDIHLKRFVADDWQVFKAIRLEALQNEPGNFGAHYGIDAARSDEEWIGRLKRDDYWAFWGLYDGNECIGLTGIEKNEEDRSCADLVASYIRMGYRRMSFSELYYDARINWAKDQGYKCFVARHRLNNSASKAAIQKYRFVYTSTTMIEWPDGSFDQRLEYRLEI